MVFIHLLGDFLPSFVAAFVCKKKKIRRNQMKKKRASLFHIETVAWLRDDLF